MTGKISRRITIAVLLCIFAVGAVLAFTGSSVEVEAELARHINPTGAKNTVMYIITWIGKAYGVIGIALIMLIIPATRRRIGITTAAVILTSWLSNTLIKAIVARERPAGMLLEESSSSFPSGHAMNNAALYITIMLLTLRVCKTRLQRVITLVAGIGMPFAIGVSRVYFNVHYISDVVSGWCLGAVIAIIGVAVYSDICEKKKLKP